MANEVTVRDEKAIEIKPLGELQVGSQAATALQEIQGAIFLAKQFPRDEARCFGKLMESCKRETLAQKANYSFPRGGATVSGPSVVLARVAQQCYGNMRSGGPDILRDDDESVLIECWAWDIENNVRISMQDSFKKLVFRKQGGWVKPDERDLRELINRRGAILERNCILKALPRDLIEDAQAMCRKTLKGNIKDPKGAQKRLILDFGDYGVSVEQLQEYVGAEEWDADHLVELQEVLTAIKDGAAKPSDYFWRKEPESTETKTVNGRKPATTGTLKKGDAATHQGYEKKVEPTVPEAPHPAGDEVSGDYITPAQVAELEGICAERGIVIEALNVWLREIMGVPGGFEKVPTGLFDRVKSSLLNVRAESINNMKEVNPRLFR